MTSTLKDQQPPANAIPAAAAAPPVPVDAAASKHKHRLSCTACSVPGNHRYAGASQKASPATSRRNSQLKNLTPLSNSNSSQDSLITHKSNNNNNNNHPHNTLNISTQNHTLDLTTLSSSSPPQASSGGFKLNFYTRHSQPKIKCHIDHLHQDLELDVKLDGNHDDNNNDPSNNNTNSASRFTLNCYNPHDPNKNLKLRVELVKTSAKGFGLKIVQYTPCPLSLTDSDNEASSLASKKEKSTNIPKSSDISELDEVRISSGKMSKVGDDGEDHCKCTHPCGALGCKATMIIPKEKEVNP